MKKILTIILCTALLFVMCASLSSCKPTDSDPTDTDPTDSSATNPIDFDKKYILLDENYEYCYYVFYSDHTGIYEIKYTYESSYSSFTLSGRIEFEWREASDNGVYLFEVKTHYNEDSTEGHKLDLIKSPLHFSDDFLVTSEGRYIKEGSDLDKILKDK